MIQDLRRYEKVRIDDLIPYEMNARTHSSEQIEKIRHSIREFGFINPILIDGDNNVIAGHGRIEAAKQEGYTELPCLFIEDLTETQKRAYILADNRLALDAGWDFEKLKIEIDELKSLNFEIDVIGFTDDELDIVFDTDKFEVVEDDFEITIPQEPKSKLGNIYKLGRHRLMCGDSTSKNDVDFLVYDNEMDLIFTDPPYGMNAVSKSGVLKERYGFDILGDSTNEVAINSFNLCQKMFGGIKQVWWGANYYTECLPSSECWIVWDKNNGQSDQTDCELAYSNFRSVVRQFTLTSEKTNRVHPTQKPIKLVDQFFNKFDKDSNIKNVIDLFGGSGTTLIACEQTDRNCYMMELDPKYVDVIIERWEKFTGGKAELIHETV